MGRHPGLSSRQIPFVILAIKKDLPGAMTHTELYKQLQVDRLKTMNNLRYSVVSTQATADDSGMNDCLQLLTSTF